MSALSWKKQVELDNGIIVGHWVLSTLIVNMKTAKAGVSYEGYLDQAAFDGGKAKILEKSVEIDFSSFDKDGSLAEAIINLVKSEEIAIEDRKIAAAEQAENFRLQEQAEALRLQEQARAEELARKEAEPHV